MAKNKQLDNMDRTQRIVSKPSGQVKARPATGPHSPEAFATRQAGLLNKVLKLRNQFTSNSASREVLTEPVSSVRKVKIEWKPSLRWNYQLEGPGNPRPLPTNSFHTFLKSRAFHMKNYIMQSLLAVATAGMVCSGGIAQAEESAESNLKRFSGTIAEVDPINRTITGDGFWFWSSPRFHLGEDCEILLKENSGSSADDLKAGQKVQIRYQEMGGVKVAKKITEQRLQVEGRIASVDQDMKTLKVKDGWITRQFALRDECQITGPNENRLALSDLKPGHMVKVTYLDARSGRLATFIRQDSKVFKGDLESVDADSRTIRIQHLLSEKRFALADDCLIQISHKPQAKLENLGIGDTLVVYYDILDGVMVANRIERESTENDGQHEIVPVNQATHASPKGR